MFWALRLVVYSCRRSPKWNIATNAAPLGRVVVDAAGDGRKIMSLPAELADYELLSVVLGRVSDRAVTVSAVAKEPLEAVFDFGPVAGSDSRQSKRLPLPAGEPTELVFDQLRPNTEYGYRLQYRPSGKAAFRTRPTCRFHTQRAAGSTFSFGVQGDSHPERPQMSDPELYARTLLNAAAGKPDFYVCMGDDSSVDTLGLVTAETVAERYTVQRPFLGLVAQSAPLFLVNGNHEQASRFNYNQTDLRHEVAVWTQSARNRFCPTPAPDRVTV